MPSPFAENSSENDEILVELPDSGLRIDRFIAYHAHSDFLTPSDVFSFQLAGETVPSDIREELYSGARFSLSVNSYKQIDGIIDRVETFGSRGGGTVIQVEGRDLLGQVVSAGADPLLRYADAQTLADLVKTVFDPFGFTGYLIRDEDDLSIRTGSKVGPKVSKKGKPLKNYILHRVKPYPMEGAFAFASRVAQRYGLWIWLSAQGNQVIVGKPTFDTPALYSLRRKLNDVDNALTNIESGEVVRDNSDQPSCIVAAGFSYGGEFPRARIKVICVNEFVALDDRYNLVEDVRQIIAKHADAVVLPARKVFNPNDFRQHRHAQPLYLQDQESQTIEQLSAFARREMSLRQMKGLTAHYVVEGHAQNGVVWTVDTIVDVDDDECDLHGPMWIKARTFEKGRSGTKTTLELVRPYTSEFGDGSGEGVPLVKLTSKAVPAAQKGRTYTERTASLTKNQDGKAKSFVKGSS